MVCKKIRTVFATQRFPMYSRQVLDFLADGQWKGHQYLATLLSLECPPEYAARHARTASGYGHGRISNVNLPMDQLLQKGYRSLVSRMLSQFFVSGLIEKKKLDGQTYYRLTQKGFADHAKQEAAKARPVAP